MPVKQTKPEPPNRPIEMWDMDKLKQHPLQDNYFLMRGGLELQELADHIKRHGLLQPIDILPDGTILSGHQRWHAIGLFVKWKNVKVRVRHDLKALGRPACEEYFLSANFQDRQKTPLEMLRAYARADALAPAIGRQRAANLKRQVEQRFRRTGRHISRLMAILDTPSEVQRAFERQEIRQNVALRVAAATKEQQEQIATLIKEECPPNKAVKRILGLTPTRTRKPETT